MGENIDIDIDIDKKYLRNIDIDIDKEILKISIFKEDLNNTSFYIYGYCGELYRMTFHEIYPKSAKKAFFCPCKAHFITPSPCTPVKNVFLLLLLVKISIGNIDCRYIDTFEKYRYRYRYRYGEVENIDIDRAILKNIDIDKLIPKISISISIW